MLAKLLLWAASAAALLAPMPRCARPMALRMEAPVSDAAASEPSYRTDRC